MRHNMQPLDKGRVCVAAERYQTKELDQHGNPVMKNRYANIGRVTLWPAKDGSNAPNVEFELDTLPIGANGPIKTYTFWDSDNQDKQTGYAQAPQHAPPPPQGYAPPPQGYSNPSYPRK